MVVEAIILALLPAGFPAPVNEYLTKNMDFKQKKQFIYAQPVKNLSYNLIVLNKCYNAHTAFALRA